MKKTIFAVSVASLVALTHCGGSSVSSGKTLIDVNGTKITEGDLQFLSTLNPAIASQLASPIGKKQILDNLLEQELLYQAAKKEGINRDTNVQAKIDLYRKVILAQSYVEAQGEKEAKKYFDEHKDEFERLKLSHIMIHFASPEEMKAAKKGRSEPEALKLANQIYDQLKKGAKFDALAKKYSDDTASKESGGALGDVAKNDPRFVMRGLKPLVDKAFEMKVGEIGGPIKSTVGYHIIIVTAPAEMAPFEAVKDQLAFKTRGDVRRKVVAELKEKGKVVYADEVKSLEEVKEPAATVPTAPAPATVPTTAAQPGTPPDHQPPDRKPQPTQP